MTLSTRHIPPLLLLIAIISFGALVRLSHLDRHDLLQEELSHFYAGNSLARGYPPQLPSGQWYTRGIEYSRLTHVAQRWLDSPELAVRLPSALLGIACLVVMAIGAWMMAGPWTAVGATLLLALYPDAVTQSRIGRFYMFQLLASLLGLFGGWLVLKHRTLAPRYATWISVVLVTLVLLVAAHTQVTGLLTLLAWWLCLAGAGLWDVFRAGRSWRQSVPLQFAALGVLMAVVLVVADPTLLDKVVVRALSRPYWTRVRETSASFYFSRLIQDFNLLVLAPLGFVYLLLRRRALGAYLLIMFAVPAVILSFVLPFKAERFLLPSAPALFIAFAAALAAAGAALFGRIESASRWSRKPSLRKAIAIIAIAILASVAVASMRAPRTAWKGYFRRMEPRWSRAAEILRARADLRAVPFGASKSLPPGFYWGRIDFNVGRNFLEQWSFVPLGEAGVASGQVGAYRSLPMGSPDLYAGVPVVTTVDAIKARFADAGAVVIGVDGQARFYGMVDSTLTRVLATEAEELCKRKCGSLDVYYWRFR